VVNVNKMTTAPHKQSATQSGASRQIIRRSVGEAFTGF
jgi:hypothetical protein